MLYDHDLIDDAKRELIDIVFDGGATESEKAKSRYLLGTIAFEQGNIRLAVDTWQDLKNLHPSSRQAKLVEGRIEELVGIVGNTARDSLDNAIALAYLNHARF